MSILAITKELNGDVESVCNQVTEAIKSAGFGILTRIDFDKKIEEKLNQKINKTVILGACNPKIAYEAFQQSTDVALLIPCNIVVREIAPNKVIVEAMRPTKMLDFLKDVNSSEAIEKAEADLSEIILGLS